MKTPTKFIASFLAILAISTPVLAQSVEDSADDKENRELVEKTLAQIEQRKAQREAQTAQAVNQYRNLIAAKEAGEKCSALPEIAISAADTTSFRLRLDLVGPTDLSFEQLDKMAADIKSVTDGNSCEDLIADPQIQGAFNFAILKANEYLTVWEAYLEAAGKHEAGGGDISDYDCGVFYPIASLQAIRSQTKAASQIIAGTPNGQAMLTSARNFANSFHSACQTDPGNLLGHSMISIMLTAQGIARKTAEAE